MKTLLELYKSHSGKVSDKWALYLREYDRLFAPYRDQAISMLEIGVQNGGSLEIWSQYFPRAQKFVGCDINPDCTQLRYDDPRITVIVGDATTPQTRAKVLQQIQSIDLIIEDGSHISGDIVKAFINYFPVLREGGLFVAEDLHCSYWGEYQGGLYHPYNSIALFNFLVYLVNFEHWGVSKKRSDLISGFKYEYGIDISEELLGQIGSVKFYNSICVIEKKGSRANDLGPRVVAGLDAAVAPVISTLNNTRSEPISQDKNHWSTLEISPAEKNLPIDHELQKALDRALGQLTDRDKLLAGQNDQLDSLSRAISERDRLIAGQNDQINALRLSLMDMQRNVHAFENSLSWRITAPARWLGQLVRAPLRTLTRNSRLSRGLVALLLLPSAVVVFGGVIGLLRRVRAGRGVVADVIDGQSTLRERMEGHPRLLRHLVFGSYSAARRLRQTGSLQRAISNFTRIWRSEGLAGLKGRFRATAPRQCYPGGGVIGNREKPALPESIARRILVADYRVPRANVSAGERATVGILRDLCMLGYEVVFLPNDMAPSPRYEAEVLEAGAHIVTRESGFDHSSQYLDQHGSEFGVFYLIRVDVAETLLPVIRRVAPDARVLFHAPDLYFLRETREAELRNDATARASAQQTRERELAIMGRCDRVVVVSPAEVQVLQELIPDTPISVFPVLYAPVAEHPQPYGHREHVFFLGGFGHTPNIDAVQWFATEVWPAVRASLPDLEFHIVGAEAPASVTALGKLPGIKVVGFVPDLTPLLATYRVGVAPLLYGAGIKGKVAVTMGGGIPCVCTDIAAEGMGIEHDVHALVANDPMRFAQAVVQLYQDEKTWSRLSRHGQALVQERFGDAANRAHLWKVLDDAQALPLSLFCEYCQTAQTGPVPDSAIGDAVDVSVIVPVYNKWHLTRACLTSVVQTSVGSGVRYELILADDGSTDETVRATELFPGLRIVRTPQNLGFLRNCNHAAQQARGRYLLLLNNDTIVLPGWLESLYHTMEKDPSIAIAGSKLLYPNGEVQEAGGAIFNNGSAINVGRGFGRWNPVFNLRREVDYISGASILIRTSFWTTVGGFDQRYKTAYCEDSDLAMTARSVGMRVVYEPESNVVHFEHQSYAEQAPSHNASLQNHNIAILVDKWKHVLSKDHLPVCAWQLAASKAERSAPTEHALRRRSGKLNVLYFTPFPSHPTSHGNRSTIFHFAKSFQRLGHRIHFALLQSHEYGASDLEAMASTWDTLDVLPFSNPMMASEQEIHFDGWYEEGLGERIRLLCARYDIDIVFCSYIFQSKMLEYVPDYILKVIDTHDKMGDRYQMLRQNGQPLEFFSCSPEEEGAYLRRADVVVARREEEARYFNSVSGRQTAIVIPHVEDPHFINREYDTLRNVGIVASANRINLAIVRDCLEAIDRQLAGRPSPFTVHIAGQVKDLANALPANERAVFHRAWVRLHGFVPDIAQFYGDIDLVISPVTMGTGINVKTVQAMAYGMPLLTTAWGAKGIETQESLHNHPGLDELAASLLHLANVPAELARLADVSKQRYRTFHEEADRAMRHVFTHPKLI